MKLIYSPTSPFVRKVAVTAIETGLEGRIERVTLKPGDAALAAVNPLGKVPALVLDDGTALAGSSLICEYLDSLHQGARLFPAAGAARWRALGRLVIADGIMEAAVLRVQEAWRDEGERSPAWVEKQTLKISDALDLFEADARLLDGPLAIDTIALGCAVGYVDLRAPDEGWRASRPKLAAWYAGFAEHPSMAATRPPT